MDKTKLMQRLMATFLEEMEEHLRSLNQDLLALEKNPDPAEQAERVHNLFRAAHSLKGAARSVNVQMVEGACHHLEEILSAARDGRVTLGPLFGLLFDSVDALEEAGMRLREQQDLADAPLAGLIAQLEAAVANMNPAAPRPSREPRTAPPPKPIEPMQSGPSSPVSPSRQAAALAVPSPAPTPPPQGPKPMEPAAAAGSLRIAADKLDSLLARSGELLVARRLVESRLGDVAALQDFVEQWKNEWQRSEKSFLRMEKAARGHAVNGAGAAVRMLRDTKDQMQRLKKDLDRLAKVMRRDSHQLEQVAGPLDEEVRRVRMLPFVEACAGLDRMVRDLAQAQHKEVELTLTDNGVELDRSILEGLKDPLRHLVRNAVDHGVETPSRRAETGKTRLARVQVAAELRGAQVEVTIEDDGRGLDLEALRVQAQRRGLAEPADESELVRLIFMPGFSTAPLITDISGRGVGLDVVKSKVEALHGTVDLSYVPGAGTRFCLTVPLTLTTLRAVLVRAAGQTYAFAGTNVHKLVRAQASDVRSVAGRTLLSLGGHPLPFAPLAAVLQSSAVVPLPNAGKFPVLIVAAGDKQFALAVDEFVAEQEIVVKSLGARIRHAPFVAGATVLPSGRIALVLNAANVVRSALRMGAVARTEQAVAPEVKRKRVLIAEDSVTTRTLEKTILESAGYEVETAVDGLAAWHYLQEHEVDLLVSDVEMPRMDGFELTRSVRTSPKLRELPVILVTALQSDQDKGRGIEVGADAYLVKSAFDQRNLLETIAQLL